MIVPVAVLDKGLYNSWFSEVLWIGLPYGLFELTICVGLYDSKGVKGIHMCVSM